MIARFGALLLLLLNLQGCATYYSAAPIEGWVIDKATREPLEGVNVVAHWVLVFGQQGRGSEDLVLMESVTDKNGRYYFPPWDSVKVPDGLGPMARLDDQDPELIFFKAGYGIQAKYNQDKPSSKQTWPTLRTSQWHGKTIELQKYGQGLADYGLMLTIVLTGTDYGQCNWKKIPRMILALEAEGKRVEKLGIRAAGGALNRRQIELLSEGNKCGSVAEFFREYEK